MAAGNIDEAKRRFVAACIGAVRVVGEDLLGEAQRRAPVEEGTLRASGELEIEHDPATGMIVAVVSFNTVYAARQHEELGWHHPRGGQAKYLESVLLERGNRYTAIMAASMRGAL